MVTPFALVYSLIVFTFNELIISTIVPAFVTVPVIVIGPARTVPSVAAIE